MSDPVDYAVPDWVPPPVPERKTLHGRFCRVEPLDPAIHAVSLYAANSKDREGRIWTYMSYGPFETFDSYRFWMERATVNSDPSRYAIVDAATNQATGVASYRRINAAAGCIEVGSLVYSPLLQRTAAATEAMYLMMDNAFELGYRRYQWGCNVMNTASQTAARRLGFSFEGVSRQEHVIKGRNVDVAYYSVIDREWPALREVFLHWLDPQNCDANGKQRTQLSGLTRPLLKQ